MHFPQPQYRPDRFTPVMDLALWPFYSQDTQMTAIRPNWMQSLESVCFVWRQAPRPHTAQVAENNHPGGWLLAGSWQSREGVSFSSCRSHTADFSAVSPSDSAFCTVLHLFCPKGSWSHPPGTAVGAPVSHWHTHMLPPSPRRSSSFLNALLFLTSAKLRIPCSMGAGDKSSLLISINTLCCCIAFFSSQGKTRWLNPSLHRRSC